jgi:hypothetical protein
MPKSKRKYGICTRAHEINIIDRQTNAPIHHASHASSFNIKQTERKLNMTNEIVFKT